MTPGRGLWEEVSLVVKGGNYGWNVKEGNRCFDAENPDVSPARCPGTAPGGVPLRNPVIQYSNANNPAGGIGLVVVGGHVYRGRDLPQLRGSYIFGDWSRSFRQPDGTLLAAQSRSRGLWRIQGFGSTSAGAAGSGTSSWASAATPAARSMCSPRTASAPAGAPGRSTGW